MRAPTAALLLLAVACSGGPSAEDQAACDVLSADANGRPVADRLTSWLKTPAELVVYVTPDRADRLDELRDQLAAIDGVEVTGVLDQASYEEFLVLFADTPEFTANITPELLPPSIQLGGDSGALQEAEEVALEHPDVREAVGYPEGGFELQFLALRYSAQLEDIAASDSAVAESTELLLEDDSLVGLPLEADRNEFNAGRVDAAEDIAQFAAEVCGIEI